MKFDKAVSLLDKMLSLTPTKKWKISFQEKQFLLIGDRTGPICTREQYENFEESFAHLFEDGRIRRHGQEIGTIDDIEFIEEIE